MTTINKIIYIIIYLFILSIAEFKVYNRSEFPTAKVNRIRSIHVAVVLQTLLLSNSLILLSALFIRESWNSVFIYLFSLIDYAICYITIILIMAESLICDLGLSSSTGFEFFSSNGSLSIVSSCNENT